MKIIAQLVKRERLLKIQENLYSWLSNLWKRDGVLQLVGGVFLYGVVSGHKEEGITQVWLGTHAYL